MILKVAFRVSDTVLSVADAPSAPSFLNAQVDGMTGKVSLWWNPASDDLTPEHSVGQAVELFLEQMAIPADALRWTAISRGRRLDAKQRLADLEERDSRWMVLPEVSAGAR